ncbi:NADPH-ferrihemoprotein reductase [Fistulifera solaris]|uniref:NADPH--hemoprotein reductase n=1 Tax=Fistulifera solaris TaxID=1519565 RepID=A0A1Z5J8N7_FISSO|nr:NADPH-ferrihemoprotein reductase [Fistulifera solaris]|eukprot:GAX10319.1 NADPH-ferrihemoprotein reductase [Fistulifera solaris]
MTEDITNLLSSISAISGIATVLLGSLLAYVLLKRDSSSASSIISPTTTTSSSEKVPLDPNKYPGGEITVYYGTQTGTAESFARVLEREGPQYGFFVHVIDLEDVTVEDVASRNKNEKDGIARAILISATYGEGEAPDNAIQFANELCEKANTQILFQQIKHPEEPLEPTCLQNVHYSIFGLGNKQYDHYNSMAKFLDHAMERCGAQRLAETGLGDDDDDLESDFENWKDQVLWPALKKQYLQQEFVGAASMIPENEWPECPYAIEYHPSTITTTTTPVTFFREDQIHSHSRHYFTAIDCPVRVKRELRTDQDPGSTVHVEIDLSAQPLFKYQTADNLGVLPINDPVIVEQVAQSLSLDLDQVFSLQAAPNHEWHGAPFPMPLSVRECLMRYCDLTGAPRRSDLKLLASYATDPIDQKVLLRMASKEGRNEYREKILEEYVGMAGLLQKCPSIQMPLEHFLGICPLLQTRFFTISSSSSVHPNTVHLTVAVTEHERKDGTLFQGVCSNHLASRQPSVDTVRVFVRASTFRLPKDTSRPILMIGPGTGIAPMRALLQEREYQRHVQKKTVGQNILYFGCKTSSQDYIYRDEMEAWVQNGVLDHLRVAFSRETEGKKVYVQHLLVNHSEETWHLLEQEGAYVYVCGAVKMGQDVAEALNKIVSSHGNLSHDEAKAYLSQMSAEGRFVQELWA